MYLPTGFLLLATLATAAIASASEADSPEFDRDIRPLLKNRCVKCHGPLKQEGKLNLATPGGVVRGGENGPVIVPGNIAESRLWELIDSDEMPVDDPLPANEKNLIHRWIITGASGLPGQTSDEEYWAFKKLVPTLPKDAKASPRTRNSLDVHLETRLAKSGLTLSPEASRHALIRRVSLDLTGLPPSVEEIEAFVNDPHPLAYENMVERYLASPDFGERWGKHWLDAAGYADSNGYFSADTDRPLAYRYRDYVIRSLNEDKPFDRFIREQLAGDEMAGFRPGEPVTPQMIELLEATHFLRNGQDGTDIGVQEPEAFEIDRRAALEAVVQVTSTSLMGLSMHCARCHDHKYDPISQEEYYQFQAIFFPAFNPKDWINPKDRVVYAYLPGEKEEWEKKQGNINRQLSLLRLEQQLSMARDKVATWLGANLEPSEILFEERFDEGWQTRWTNTAPGDDKAGGQVTIGGSQPHAARVANGALQLSVGPGEAWLSTIPSFDWTPREHGDWIQATFDLVDNKVASGPAERIGYTIAAHDFDDSGTVAGGNILIDGNPSTATSIYRDYPGGDSGQIGAIGGTGYVPGERYGVRVTNTGEGNFRLEHLVNGVPEGQSLELKKADLPDGGFAFFYCSNRSFIVDQVRVECSVAQSMGGIDLVAIRKAIEERRNQYEKRRKELEAQLTPQPGRAIAWVSDKSAKPPAVPFLTRGLYHLGQGEVQPGVLRALSEVGATYEMPALPPDALTTARRTAFANWLTRAGSRPAALLARVHVNRVWRQYFGRGIVATTDNFGVSGSPPSHPELLEELAAEFVADGWSQKSLHRRIVNSAAYRQSSASREEGLAADPDNRLWWRWPIRRLEAEVIRDSMLAVSGELDLTRFGPYVPTVQTPVGEVIVDEKIPGARRRSVYLQQRRSQTVSFMKVFDAPAIATVCTTRPSSTVPLQSLALLNSDFALLRGEGFARRLLAETDGTPAEIIERAWAIAAGRLPTATEADFAAEFLASQSEHYSGNEAQLWATADFCQMLMASNAFLYVE